MSFRSIDLGFGPEKESDLYLKNARSINKFVHDAYGPRISAGTEFFVLISLDQNYRVIQTNVLAEGEADHVAIRPREFMRILDAANMTSGGRLAWFVLAHNHPSGSPVPSPSDYSMTEALIQFAFRATSRLGLIDHVVVTPKRSVFGSMADLYPGLIGRR